MKLAIQQVNTSYCMRMLYQHTLIIAQYACIDQSIIWCHYLISNYCTMTYIDSRCYNSQSHAHNTPNCPVKWNHTTFNYVIVIPCRLPSTLWSETTTSELVASCLLHWFHIGKFDHRYLLCEVASGRKCYNSAELSYHRVTESTQLATIDYVSLLIEKSSDHRLFKHGKCSYYCAKMLSLK